MASHPVPQLSPERFLELEREAAEKHEYLFGEMVAMAGGSPRHALICLNAGAALHQALRGKPCLTFSPDARVSVFWDKLITYPDVTVVCGKPAYADDKQDTITNPTLLVEVLSPSTRNHDKGEKASLYRQMPSLQEFLIIEQNPPFVEQYRRLPDGSWQIVAHSGLEGLIRLESVAVELAMAEIYAGVDAL